MRPDGSEARPLTAEPTYHYGPPAWSPDGQTLLVQRYNLAAAGSPGIWLINVATGEQQEIAPLGIQPTWLP